MKVIINLSNRWLYTIIAIGILAIIGVGVYAVAGVSHSSDEIDEVDPTVPACSNGQILQTSAGAWSCVDMPSTTTDTNANTECSGTYMYLSGEGACRDVRTDGDLYDTDTNTNAGTICSGTTQFLAGDGNCKTGYLDADGVDDVDGGVADYLNDQGGGNNIKAKVLDFTQYLGGLYAAPHDLDISQIKGVAVVGVSTGVSQGLINYGPWIYDNDIIVILEKGDAGQVINGVVFYTE